MPLDIRWEDEKGKVLAECPDWFAMWNYIDEPDEIQSTYCLRFLDEYGDTTFNQYQIPVLIEELESLFPKSKDEEAKKSLNSIIEFIRQADGRVHTYIKFYGD